MLPYSQKATVRRVKKKRILIRIGTTYACFAKRALIGSRIRKIRTVKRGFVRSVAGK